MTSIPVDVMKILYHCKGEKASGRQILIYRAVGGGSKSLPLQGNTVNLRLKMAKRKDVEIE